MGGLLSAKRTTLVAAALVFAVVGLLPLGLMIGSSLWVDGGFSVRNYVEVLGNARTWVLFRNSLLLATLTTAVAGLAGVTLGILVAKTDLPLRNSLSVIFSLPLLFPPYILAVGWFEILGRGGILTRWIGLATGETTSQWLFGLPGAVLVLASAFLPIVLLLTITYLRGMNPGFEEAGRLSCGWPAVIRRIPAAQLLSSVSANSFDLIFATVIVLHVFLPRLPSSPASCGSAPGSGVRAAARHGKERCPLPSSPRGQRSSIRGYQMT